jgi:anti-sigma regulatory factor (Ser/Thr protein kinase)
LNDPPTIGSGSARRDRLIRRFVVSDKASLSDVRHSIRDDLGRFGASEQSAFDCVVAVTEACTNALEYGGSDDEGRRPPMVWWEIDPHTAIFQVEDHSARRWAMASHPSKGEDLLRDRGRGFQVMHGLMDEVEVVSVGVGTTVRLTKRF